MPRPTHFEIPAENPERAMQFYSSVLGWKFNKWPGPVDYWLISTGDPGEPGIDGGLMQRRDPNQPCVNTVRVTNVDESLAAVARRSGHFAGASGGGGGAMRSMVSITWPSSAMACMWTFPPSTRIGMKCSTFSTLRVTPGMG
jgi:uncharacterized protein